MLATSPGTLRIVYGMWTLDKPMASLTAIYGVPWISIILNLVKFHLLSGPDPWPSR